MSATRRTDLRSCDPKSECKVSIAARRKFGSGPAIRTHYEHGQWWVFVTDPLDREKDDRTYSVVDASGCGSVLGFDFEEVS